ncbi:MAG TPA: glycyl-radical enzyme activating protein [Clostridiaceae bacterium]|nr:glycyl-radical enzyme activating protein [Clostridiaceae bacterium]
MIFNVQRFSTHDGNGIRTIVFFKGCPLRCPWCSNPESQSFDYDIFFDKQKCIGCMECVKVSRNKEFIRTDEGISINRDNITDPLLFKDICPAKAIQVIGEEIDVEKLVKELEKERVFYDNSGGGVTFSGGEPFAQPEQLIMLAKELKKKGISIAVETCLDVPWENIEVAIKYVDEFLIDLKHVNGKKLNEVTCGNFAQIEYNLRKLEAEKVPVTIRIPVIPGFNHNADDMHAIIDYLDSFNNISELHLLPYHSFGKGKYQQLGRDYKLRTEALDKSELEPFLVYANNKGLKTVIGG